MGSGAWGMRWIALGATVVVALLATPGSASAAFWNASAKCFDTSQVGRVMDPPDLGSFQIHLLGNGISDQVGLDLQAALVQGRVTERLNEALGVYPRGYPPRRLPLYVTSRAFDVDGNRGKVAKTCPDRSVYAAAVRANVPRAELPSTATHELFHAYSNAVLPLTRRTVTWFEEASATFSEWKLGFRANDDYDEDLKPQLPMDSNAAEHEYAMWRFVRFMDSRGLVEGPFGGWPLIRNVISGYSAPSATETLAQQLGERGTSLADELSAFWGDRLKLRPSSGGDSVTEVATNEQVVRISPGRRTFEPEAGRLETWFKHFKVASSVERIEFEFEPRDPTQGQFWGSVTPRTSEQFRTGDTIAFCVRGRSPAELKFPARGFPITYTHGQLGGPRVLRSEVEVFAQRDAEQCEGPLGNRACQLLSRSNVTQLFGAGQFPFYTAGERRWRCVFVNNEESREVDMILQRARPNADLRALRRRFRAALAEGGFTAIPEGDVAGYITTETEGTVVHTVLMLVGREVNAINLYRGGVQEARTLAARIAGLER